MYLKLHARRENTHCTLPCLAQPWVCRESQSRGSGRVLTWAGGDCRGLFSSRSTCSCFISLKQLGITRTLLQEKSNFTKGRSTSSETERKENALKEKKKKISENSRIKQLHPQKLTFCISGGICGVVKPKASCFNVRNIRCSYKVFPWMEGSFPRCSVTTNYTGNTCHS